MTEAEPGTARPSAGEVGVHRQDVAEPVTEPVSLNAVPQRGTAAEAGGRESEEDMDGDIHRDNQRDRGATRTEARTDQDRDQDRDEISEVRQEIERTRDDLGDTIEALTAKADVKGRAQERLHETAMGARAKASGVAERVREATPGPVRGTVGRVGEQARRRPGAFAAAGATVTAFIILRRVVRARVARMRAARTTRTMRAMKTMRGTRIAKYLKKMRMPRPHWAR
jgi:hypothetical protein